MNEFVDGVTPESAWLLAEAFGTSPEFWLNLQSNYDLERSKPKRLAARIITAASIGSKD
jgi:plasmid maintenance system antidote protein VapI